MKIVISLHELNSEWFSPIFMKSNFLWHYLHEFNLFTPMTDFVFLTLKSWFYSWMQPTNIADIHFHSLWQAPTTTKAKKIILLFTLVKCFRFQLVICQMLISHLWKLSNQSEFVQFITNQFFFSNLAWSKSQYVYDKPAYILKHLKKFGPG